MVKVKILDERGQVIGGKAFELPDRPYVGDEIRLGTRCQHVLKVTATLNVDNQDYEIETETI
jgi:hypothetical protein